MFEAFAHTKEKLGQSNVGSLFALVCPCFRQNEIVTCINVYVMCSANNFLLECAVLFIFSKY